MEFVKVQGKEFVYKGKPIQFKGLGVGTWLNLEHFMLGIPTPDKMMKEAFAEVFGEERKAQFFQDFVYNFFTEEDVKVLSENGLNLIRVPFNYRLFIDDEKPGQLKEEGFQYFDYLFDICRKHGVFVLPDLHAVPGGQNPDWHSDNQTGVPQFWEFGVFQTQIIELWKAIALRYADETCLLGYDLLNEPFLMKSDTDRLQKFYNALISAIREVDSNHILFIEGNHFAMDFTKIQRLNDEQTTLTFHFYPTVWEPDLCDVGYDRKKRKVVFEERFQTLLEDLQRFERPLLCGEAGYDIAGHSLEHVIVMVEDTLELFEKYKVSWTLWCYKDASFMGVVYPRADSLWMKFADEIHKDWTHYKEMDMGNEIAETMDTYFPLELNQEFQYMIQFRIRGLLYLFQKEQILKPLLQRLGWEYVRKMPESFLFENCEYYGEYLRLLKSFT